jgi:hypothetical protein
MEGKENEYKALSTNKSSSILDVYLYDFRRKPMGF